LANSRTWFSEPPKSKYFTINKMRMFPVGLPNPIWCQ